MRNKVYGIVKRFKCSSCGYLSPAGYLVEEVKCPNCNIQMVKGLYKQFLNHCEEVKYEGERG